ncbi:hypothetical protein HPB48_026808 [Haemaphysalis longicornis]|uniref:Uncharacterized protein n=1 Tax=Haemaphysalis longicornis TaxID=44386 RepID=A0A9J6HBN7_HAELO|nr:hypothetical protein HPB48_026808 [Haemaphysalis longicornis]
MASNQKAAILSLCMCKIRRCDNPSWVIRFHKFSTRRRALKKRSPEATDAGLLERLTAIDGARCGGLPSRHVPSRRCPKLVSTASLRDRVCTPWKWKERLTTPFEPRSPQAEISKVKQMLEIVIAENKALKAEITKLKSLRVGTATSQAEQLRTEVLILCADLLVKNTLNDDIKVESPFFKRNAEDAIVTPMRHPKKAGGL